MENHAFIPWLQALLWVRCAESFLRGKLKKQVGQEGLGIESLFDESCGGAGAAFSFLADFGFEGVNRAVPASDADVDVGGRPHANASLVA